MQILPLTSEHADDAARLWSECGLTRPWNDPRSDFRMAVSGPSSEVLGALDDDLLVGTVMVGHEGHRGWIYYLAIDQAHRGSGLGKALVAAAEEWIEGQGIPKVMLMIRAENDDVRRFYERLGYVDQGVSVLGRFLDEDLQRLRQGSA
ncbi:putative acetyltransferase [Serinicoccus hydrothermalis]|uniref:Putative acetyltransferase n=1 Tax=Serinicoccus hydrothermalis TaxID=1758689 RepID=A0A1B1NFK4_9MICO|nr:GNAT family acetyltransferase [Serinicoccus hydrothermalis]ANS80221.1 putative acetyltransferase [Serinicoccus hydrothermalis]